MTIFNNISDKNKRLPVIRLQGILLYLKSLKISSLIFIFCFVYMDTSLAQTDQLDKHFLAILSSVGVIDAAHRIGLDFDKYLLPLAAQSGHPYRSYRWSVGSDAQGNMTINAFPPAEELGWTPWEKWLKKDGKLRHESWVLYPLREITSKGIAKWYLIDNDHSDIGPRFLNTLSTLRGVFKQSRIDVAAEVLGMNIEKEILAPLTAELQQIYKQFRWVIIPHSLADDGPVIYALPPMHMADVWPWESWYTDGKRPLIHHTHFTKSNELTNPQPWQETMGAPQRPPEIFGVKWYWFNDQSMQPSLVNIPIYLKIEK